MVFGPNGAMYLKEWGKSDQVKVQYTQASATPITVATWAALASTVTDELARLRSGLVWRLVNGIHTTCIITGCVGTAISLRSKKPPPPMARIGACAQENFGEIWSAPVARWVGISLVIQIRFPPMKIRTHLVTQTGSVSEEILEHSTIQIVVSFDRKSFNMSELKISKLNSG